MPDRANIASIEALESFRNSLVVYGEKARIVLEEIGGEVLRFKMWLQQDQKQHWKREVVIRGRALEKARQEWFSAELSDFQRAGMSKLAIKKAQDALREAETKLAVVKKWDQLYESQVDPLVRQSEKMNNILSGDVPKALAYLSNVVKLLDDYADISRAGATPSNSPSKEEIAETDPPEGDAS